MSVAYSNLGDLNTPLQLILVRIADGLTNYLNVLIMSATNSNYKDAPTERHKQCKRQLIIGDGPMGPFTDIQKGFNTGYCDITSHF